MYLNFNPNKFKMAFKVFYVTIRFFRDRSIEYTNHLKDFAIHILQIKTLDYLDFQFNLKFKICINLQ